MARPVGGHPAVRMYLAPELLQELHLHTDWQKFWLRPSTLQVPLHKLLEECWTQLGISWVPNVKVSCKGAQSTLLQATQCSQLAKGALRWTFCH